MALQPSPADIVDMTASPATTVPSAGTADVVDLHLRRTGGHRVVQAVASAPVRHIPAELLEALHGSWGRPEELGLVRRERHLRLVAG
jgi:hypothetical protein